MVLDGVDQGRTQVPSPLPDVTDLGAKWVEHDHFTFAPRPGQDVYVVQSPLITLRSSGASLTELFPHVLGDTTARFERMRGKAVYQPVGWTIPRGGVERRVQDTWEPSSELTSVSVAELRHLCDAEADEFYDNQAHRFQLRLLGIASDAHFSSRGPEAARTYQLAFLRNIARGEVEARHAPTWWDVELHTAVDPHEVQRRVDLARAPFVSFRSSTGDSLCVRVRRPELMASAVALVVHPDDERYRDVVGTSATVPVFDFEVPVLAHPQARPDQGAGIVLCCTFGSFAEVRWWRDLGLPLRLTIDRDGRMQSATPPWLGARTSAEVYGQIAGRGTQAARLTVERMLQEAQCLLDPPVSARREGRRRGRLDRDRREKSWRQFRPGGKVPLEILPTWQWYLQDTTSGPGLDRERRFMMSEQRYFGTPVPVWFRLDDSGEPDRERPLLPDDGELPVDPRVSAPSGYVEAQRGEPSGFTGDVGILSTLAMSSVASLMTSGWESDQTLFELAHPASLHVVSARGAGVEQSSELVRSRLETGSDPWLRSRMSGPVVRRPVEFSRMPDQWHWEGQAMTNGSDAFRWRVAKARPGSVTAQEASFREGRKLAVKLLHVTRFVVDGATSASADLSAVRHPVDRALLGDLSPVIAVATAALEGLKHGAALSAIEQFFWRFSRDYLELVKGRARAKDLSADTRSARATLELSLEVQLRLLAPFLPFVTQEAWSWWREGSIHSSTWPEEGELGGSTEATPHLSNAVGVILKGLRGAKSRAGVSLASEVASVRVVGPGHLVAAATLAADDLRAAGNVTGEFAFAVDDGVEALQVDVALAT